MANDSDVTASNPAVLFEDDEVIVIDKPAGLVVHADGRTVEPTLVDWILETHPALEGVGEPMRLTNGTVIERPGIVHRLDRETSGVMVLAKNQDSFLYLKTQFQDRAITKTYNAFVYGKLPDAEGVIDRPIGRSRTNPRLWSAQRGAYGTLREAVTHYRVLVERELVSYVEASPKTGRTHQIRTHFKAIHHPVVCDKLYAPKAPCLFGFTRVALHARTIRFTLRSGEEKQFEAPLPSDFVEALAELTGGN